MRLPELGAHRSALATAGAVTAIVALVTGVAVVSGGYAAQRVDLGDAAVWVATTAEQSVGRANTAVLELNSVVDAAAELPRSCSRAPVLVLDHERGPSDRRPDDLDHDEPSRCRPRPRSRSPAHAW